MDNSVMAEISKTPSEEYKKHLKEEEGTLNFIYKDTSDLDTGGTGHLMTDADKEKYGIDKNTKYVVVNTEYGKRKAATDKEGNIIRLDKDVTDAWFEKDAARYYETGRSWAEELGIEDQNMVNTLAGVSFQFPAFKSKMPSAWSAMKVGNFDAEEAIKQIKFVSGIPGTTKSKWYDETPRRVEALSVALSDYSRRKDTALIDPDKSTMEDVLAKNYGK